MSHTIEIPLEEGPLVDPPIIDFARFDAGQQEYVITFVPEDVVSTNEKEMVAIRRTDAEWAHARYAWAKLSRLLGAPLVQIAHSGGGDFSFKLASGERHVLSENSPSGDASQRVYDVVQRLGMIAQIQFLLQTRAASKTA